MKGTFLSQVLTEQVSRECGRILLPGLLVALMTGCAPLASVDITEPPPPVALVANENNLTIKEARAHALHAALLLDSKPEQSMAESALAARLSLNAMEQLSGSRTEEAVEIYNFATARLVEAIGRTKMMPWNQAIKVTGPDCTVFVTMKSASDEVWKPGADKFQVTDRMIIGGTDFRQRDRVYGVGAPLVISGKGRDKPWSPNKHFVRATALVTFSGNKCLIRVIDPGATPVVELAGEQRQVASDLSAPIAVNIVDAHPQLLGMLECFDAYRYTKAARLVMMEPYRPDKQPVIFVHGLMDSPLCWVLLINKLNGDAEFRKKYQVWYFEYPTGPPFPISAAIFRQDLARIYQRYPNTQKAVIVGHSLGGVISHMLVCDSGDHFCEDIFGKPFTQLKIPPAYVALSRSALEFKVSPYVDSVIFMATPHRGAYIAADPWGRLGALLVRLPTRYIMLAPELIAEETGPDRGDVVNRFPNSIDSMRPEAAGILALHKLKMASTIPYYSIIGDVWGGPPLKDTSDLVVGYWSSHLDNAKSETIVPNWHSDVIRGPEGVAEVQRILLAKPKSPSGNLQPHS